MRHIGLYLHIPFCDGKCYYCSFFSKRPCSTEIDEYVTYLKRSIASWGKQIDRPVDTVYFGGGTPSLLGHTRLIEIMNTVKASFSVEEQAEITLEVNPSSTEKLDFSALRKAGFNRLSVGLQSADDHELRLLGRRHSVTDIGVTVKSAQQAGFDNISLDVMLAIPEQTISSLHHTLDFCAECGVQHISAYILKIEPGTRFYQKKDILPFFDDDAQAGIYEETVRYLSELGYHQYEISNFSIEGYESRHNLKYWHDEEYLGIGPSAHSFLDNKRFYYDNSFDAFYRNEITDEGPGGDAEEYIMLALRLTEGLIFDQFRERFHTDISANMMRAAKELEKQGLVRISSESLALSVKGFLVSNAISAYLLKNT